MSGGSVLDTEVSAQSEAPEVRYACSSLQIQGNAQP